MQHEIQQPISYENFDDLPLSEHIEWNHLGGKVRSLPLNSTKSLAVELLNSTPQKDLLTKVDNTVAGLCF